MKQQTTQQKLTEKKKSKVKSHTKERKIIIIGLGFKGITTKTVDHIHSNYICNWNLVSL